MKQCGYRPDCYKGVVTASFNKRQTKKLTKMKPLEIIPLSVGEKSMLHGGFLAIGTTQEGDDTRNGNCATASAHFNDNCGCHSCGPYTFTTNDQGSLESNHG